MSSEDTNPSEVEKALRSQRQHWQEISERVSRISNRDLPPEPPKRILLFGVGSSYFAARLAGLSLLRDRMRNRVPVIVCSSMGIGLEVTPARGDWAFALSHRGKTEATLRAMELCEQAGAFTILVAGNGAPEVKSAHYVLSTTPMETCEPHTMSVTGAICAITCMLLGAKAVEEWDALRSIGDPDLELVRRRAGNGPSLIVGEWEGEWIAREGALKFMEMARLPVRAYGTEEFFHGVLHSVGDKDRLWHVGMAKDGRGDALKVAHRIGVFGASPMAYIPALVELQWAALGTALNLGVDPDLKA